MSYKKLYQEKINNYINHISNDENENFNEPSNKQINKKDYYCKISKNRFKDLVAILATILCIIAIFLSLWNIPFTNKFLVSLYENNPAIKSIVNMFIN